MMRRLVLYPFLIAVFPIVSLYAHNAREAPPSVIVAPVVSAMAATSLLWAALGRLLRDAHRAGLLVTLGWALFYTVSRMPEDLEWALKSLGDYWVPHRQYDVAEGPVVATELILFALLAYRIAARLEAPRAWTPPLNLFALILVGLPTTQILWARSGDLGRQGVQVVALPTADRVGNRPDIYYIILDGFARADVLEEIYDYDGEPFLEALEARGFQVARRSTSNYSQTRLSLASSLNARYLDELRHPSAVDEGPLRTLIAEGAVAGALRRHGYRFVSFATGYDPTDVHRADRYVSPYPHVDEFHRMLLQATPLGVLLMPPVYRDPPTLARELTLFTLDELPRVASISGPTFTFAHIVSPHPPFVFGPDGEETDPMLVGGGSRGDGSHFDGTREQYIEGYRGQVAFISRRVLATIDAILGASAEPPIIILQSDHGPGLGLDLVDPGKSDLKERMSILNAYYFPGVDLDGLGDRITPVNTFRVLLNDYFGAGLDLLPGRNYISPWETPFDFLDVTAQVAGASDSSTGIPDEVSSPQQ